MKSPYSNGNISHLEPITEIPPTIDPSFTPSTNPTFTLSTPSTSTSNPTAASTIKIPTLTTVKISQPITTDCISATTATASTTAATKPPTNLLIRPHPAPNNQPKTAPISSAFPTISPNPTQPPPTLTAPNPTSAPVSSENKPPSLRLTSTSKRPYRSASESLQNVINCLKELLKENPIEAIGFNKEILPTKKLLTQQAVLMFEDFVFIRLKEAGFGLQYDDEQDEEHNKKHSFTNSTNTSKAASPQNHLYEVQDGPEWFERWHHNHVSGLGDVTRDVHMLGLLFETTYPRICRKVTTNSMHQANNELQCKKLISSFGEHMFRGNTVTWGRIVAMFSISASVAAECCHNNDSRLLKTVITAHDDVIEKHVISWVHAQGGWRSLLKLSRGVTKKTKGLWLMLLCGVLTAIVATFTLLS